MQQIQANQLSSDQVEALVHVDQWWRGCAGTGLLEQVFTLAGYAGTGKTTVISYIVKHWPHGQVLIAAPTGKAAQRLREKGVDACTIHQLAYQFAGYDQNGNPEFDWRGMAKGRLVIIDEASMVNSEIYKDLIDNGYRMLFVGDHGQLAPVGGDPGIMRSPNFALSIIHRQDDEGLLEFAHDLRKGIKPESKGAAKVLTIDPWGESDEVISALAEADATICWKNANRHWLNHIIMQRKVVIPNEIAYDPKSCMDVLAHLMKTKARIPMLCLKNNYRIRVSNGQVLTGSISKILETTIHGHIYRSGKDPERVMFDRQSFRGEKSLNQGKGIAMFDFGFCLTAHKAQGSEWPWVAVYDDYARRDERARWAYTAATRAKDKLTWCRR